jgi:hypothetical protein
LSNAFDNSYAVYTLDYAAASAGQEIIIEYRSLALFDQQFGNVTFQAATLIGTNSGPVDSPPTVSISTPTNGASFVAPANIPVAATASDSDGSVTNLEIFNGTTKLGQSSTNAYSLVWSNVASGTYSLTATATDSMGVKSTSVPVDIIVTGASSTLQLQYQLFTTNGALGLKIFPTVPQPYSLEASSYLTNWLSIYTNSTGSNADFIEAPLTNRPVRFFRGKRWP